MASDTDEVRVVAALARRLFPRAEASSIRRVPEGVSTRVYRIPAGDEVFYLRVLPEEGSSFAPEMLAHTVLRDRGVHVPEVVHWEHRHPELDRSIMVTTEIAGQPLARAACGLSDSQVRDVLREAGRDLAIINGVPVSGFGWIRRDAPTATRLEAEHPTLRTWVVESLDADLAYLSRMALTAAEVLAIRATLARLDGMLDSSQGHLAHGDLDVTPIYVADGRYSGIIDLGEIRGADPLYDLAHFKLHDGETLPAGLLPHLMQGYDEVRPLPEDYAEQLRALSLLIATRALARRMRKGPSDQVVTHLLGAIRDEIVLHDR